MQDDRLTFVYTYYNNETMLDLQRTVWSQYPQYVKDRLHIVIVDDCSKKRLNGFYILGVPVRIYRVLDDIPWNWAGARNLALKHIAPDQWVFMSDIDHVMPVETLLWLFQQHRPKAQHAYRFSRMCWRSHAPLKRHINSYLIRVEDYWKPGGYDEDFAGYYGSGVVFAKNLAAFCRIIQLPKPLYVVSRADVVDASTRDLGRYGSEYDADREPILHAKKRGAAYVAKNPIRFKWELVQ